MFSVGWFLGLDGTACLVWQAPPGDEKTPTGGRRCPPEARATLQCYG